MDNTGVDGDFLALLNKQRGAIERVSRTYTSTPGEHEDLVQDIVYQLWRAFPSYRGDCSPLTWVYRIAINTAITGLRRRTRQPVHVPLEAAAEVAAPPTSASSDPRMELLYRALRSIGHVDRAIVMCYLDDLSYREILLGLVWWRNGVGPSFAGAMVMAVLAIAWSYRSGRVYVDQMFRRYRVDLSECLRQIEAER